MSCLPPNGPENCPSAEICLNGIPSFRSEFVTVLKSIINNKRTMKKFILAMTVVGLTVGAYAGDKASTKDKAACAGADKACCGEKATAGCPANKGKCPAQGQTAKQQANSKPVQSPKGADANKS